MDDTRYEYLLKKGDILKTEEYQYEIVNHIAMGGTSIVYLANRIDKDNHIKKVAVKELFYYNENNYLIRNDIGEICINPKYINYDQIKTLFDKYKEEFKREPELINTLKPYCNGLVDVYSFHEDIVLNDNKVNNYYIFLEPFNDNGILLNDIIKNYKNTFNCDRLQLVDALKIIKLILNSLNELHNNSNEKCGKFLHGDLKTENIYFKTSNLQFNTDEDLHIQKERIDTTSLGIAAFLDLSTTKEVMLDSDDGIYKTEEIDYDLIAYSVNSAPELIEDFKNNSETISSFSKLMGSIEDDDKNNSVKLTRSCDVFSVGVILYEILSGQKFCGTPSNSYNIYHHSFEYVDIIGCNSTVCIDILNKILDKALAFFPIDRYPSAKEFLNDICDLENTIAKKGFSKNVLFYKTEEILNNLNNSSLTKVLNDNYIINCYTKNDNDEIIEGYLEDEFEDDNYLIIGQGGIGKSTSIKKFMQKMLESKLKVPLYINLENNRYHLKDARSFNYILNLISDLYYSTDETGENNNSRGVDIIRKMDEEFSKNTNNKEYVLILEDLHKLQGDLSEEVISNINKLFEYKNLQLIITSRYKDENLKLKNILEIKPLNENILRNHLKKYNFDNINSDSLNKLIEIPIYLNMFISLNCKLNYRYNKNINSAELIQKYLDMSLDRYMDEINNDKIILKNGICYTKEMIKFLRDFVLSKISYFSYHDYILTYETINQIINGSIPLIFNGEGYDQEAEFLQIRFENYENIFDELNYNYEQCYKGRPYKKANKYRIDDIINIFTNHLGLLKENKKNEYIFVHDVYFEYFRDLYLLDKFKWTYEDNDILPLMKYTCLYFPFIDEILLDSFEFLFTDIPSDKILYELLEIQYITYSPFNKILCELLDLTYQEEFIFVYNKLENLLINLDKFTNFKILCSIKTFNCSKIHFDDTDLYFFKNYTFCIIKYNLNYALNNYSLNLINQKIYNKSNLNLKYYINKGFNINQAYQLYLGTIQNLDINQYNYIYFNSEQMLEIRLGLLEKLDISLFKNKNFSSIKMYYLRNILKLNFNINKYIKYEQYEIENIYYGLRDGVDVSIYAKPEYNSKQMEYIYYGLRDGVDVSIYAKPEYDSEQMECIYYGLKDGVDVNIYAKLAYNSGQMHWIYEGLRNKLDVCIYAKPEYDSEQMHWIYEGLRNKLDVCIYAKPEYDSEQMYLIYKKLYNLNLSNNNYDWDDGWGDNHSNIDNNFNIYDDWE